MLNITEEYINSTAPNESAVKNGLGLVKKNSFIKLGKSNDETLLLGKCKGSGSSNYICSVDFIKEDSPVFRCTCPSRQIPCKHTLGLMFAFVKGSSFIDVDIPEDILEKREKAEKRETKKNNASSEKKVNKSALAKKIKTQMEGIELLEKLIKDITRRGFAAIDKKTLDMLEEQGKTLNSSYLPGAQKLLREFILTFKSKDTEDKQYLEAMGIVTSIYSLCKRGKEHLSKRLEDAEMSLDKDSNIEELLGHAWQSAELEAMGLCETNVDLIQLFFNVYIDEARKEYVDIGYWIDLSSGLVYKNCNYRPFKALKHIKEEDSFSSVAVVSKLYIYPGEINRRVRWDEMTFRDVRTEDLEKIKSFSKRNYNEVVKHVKNIIKNPLETKEPVMLLHYKTIGKIESNYVIEDSEGKRIILRDAYKEVPSTPMLNLLRAEDLSDGIMLVRFNHNMGDGELTVQPLSIVTDEEIIRLIY